MPQSPPADPAQKQILTDMVNLSANSAVAAGNQMAVVNDQAVRFQNAQDIFTKRYNYWDGYIGAYHAERKSLNGVFILTPITPGDYTDFMAFKGRLFQAKIQSPIRISQFNNVTASPTGSEPINETNLISKEAQYRTALMTGFVGTSPLPSVSGGYTLVAPFSPGGTEIVLTTSTVVSFPTTGQLLLFNTGSPTAGVLVEWLSVTAATTQVSPGPPPIDLFTYTLKVLNCTQNFTTISSGAGSGVTTTGPVFTNSERTSKVAANPSLQSQLNAYINAYTYRVGQWSTLVTQEVVEIAAQATAGEDAPDAAYGTSLGSTNTALISYLATDLVTNTALAAQHTLNTLRSGQIPTRIAWIDARLIQQTKAYDERYGYADKLYNLGDGATPLIIKINGQSTGLATQQAASNARAASLSGEVF